MSNVVVGQRWISLNEASLGLGIIRDIDGRRLEIYFPATNEARHYAIDNAPISRISYDVGDHISDLDDNAYQVVEVIDQDGLLIYEAEDIDGQRHQITELHLNSYVQFSAPDKRLINGHIDSNDSFQLRFETFQQLDRLNNSPVSGLMGARVELLPHQLYIAHEVARRYAPRVLLADEVGLGKTIEAGLIIHHQLHSGLAQRVLIMVPDSLIHQWLVEMLRRFNLHFALYDHSRFAALSEDPHIDLDSGEAINPFEMDQLIICSIDGLKRHPDMQQQLLASEWDLLVVDEAHHLQWDINSPSDDYVLVETLSQRATGLLLLTATPEQAGLESHFARLRLLDPNRFHSLEAFVEEAKHYNEYGELVDWLTSDDEVAVDAVNKLLPNDIAFNSAQTMLTSDDKQQLLNRLIDQHGTGRVLFRNTRSAMTGFPQRELHAYPLECAEIYRADSANKGQQGLTPEVMFEPEVWLADDRRVTWLSDFLRGENSEKVLVICHHAKTAIALQDYFSKKQAIRATCFHEGLSLFERDRAAAYFASHTTTDGEQGAQVLFCSEIGSEGRNFQFAHNLVLFDLPMNPDLIEQRIGRLDRIGQTQTINIHVPYITQTSQEVMFRWFNEGLNLFQRSFSAGHSIYEQYKTELTDKLSNLSADLTQLIADTQNTVRIVEQDMHDGRDRLLELNSCRQPQASSLVESMEQEEDNQLLDKYFERLLTEFGVDQEDHSASTWIISASDHMKHDYFPGLKEDGNTVTTDRYKALSRDDIEFLSWEHPMVFEAMDMLVKSDSGNAALATISVKGLKPGTLLLESFYTVQTIAPKDIQLHRYLSEKPVRYLLDTNGKDLSGVVNHQALNGLAQPLQKKIARQVIKQIKQQIEGLVQLSHAKASQDLAAFQSSSKHKVDELLGAEKIRMTELKATNPNIREIEIERVEQLISTCHKHIDKSSMQLQGLRLVVAS
ncbi:MAG: RNA polymerase-associated protein RapA [Kangiellaceae bacterium]|jgi:ATP-dependent helicase HepA|nr:RNA polymerase-associated protein RapA [Kangiellaceae bacterium]